MAICLRSFVLNSVPHWPPCMSSLHSATRVRHPCPHSVLYGRTDVPAHCFHEVFEQPRLISGPAMGGSPELLFYASLFLFYDLMEPLRFCPYSLFVLCIMTPFLFGRRPALYAARPKLSGSAFTFSFAPLSAVSPPRASLAKTGEVLFPIIELLCSRSASFRPRLEVVSCCRCKLFSR